MPSVDQDHDPFLLLLQGRMEEVSKWELQAKRVSAELLPNFCRISDFHCRMAKTLHTVHLTSICK
eukprot:scaffold960_cov73-Skeletonema_menzelii.AAC.3